MLFALVTTVALCSTYLWFALQMVILGIKQKSVEDIPLGDDGTAPQDMSQCRNLGTLGLCWGIFIILVTCGPFGRRCFCPPAKPDPSGEPPEESMLASLSSLASSLFIGYGIRYTFNQPSFHKNKFGHHMCNEDLFEIVYGITMFSVVLMITTLSCACCFLCRLKCRASAGV